MRGVEARGVEGVGERVEGGSGRRIRGEKRSARAGGGGAYVDVSAGRPCFFLYSCEGLIVSSHPIRLRLRPPPPRFRLFLIFNFDLDLITCAICVHSPTVERRSFFIFLF